VCLGSRPLGFSWEGRDEVSKKGESRTLLTSQLCRDEVGRVFQKGRKEETKVFGKEEEGRECLIAWVFTGRRLRDDTSCGLFRKARRKYTNCPRKRKGEKKRGK